MSDKCPKCGAEAIDATHWECGSFNKAKPQAYSNGVKLWGLIRVPDCYERQLAAVTKERDELQAITDKLRSVICDVAGKTADTLEGLYCGLPQARLSRGGHMWRAGVEWVLREIRKISTRQAAEEARHRTEPTRKREIDGE